MWIKVLLLAGLMATAQDAGRGQRLFNDTAAATGRPVASCAGCHTDLNVLRAQISNRGVALNAKALRTLLQRAIAGARPGASGAKAQFRNALSEKDLDDIAAYLASVKLATSPRPVALR